MITAVRLEDGTWREWLRLPTQAERQRLLEISQVRRENLIRARAAKVAQPRGQ